MTDRELLELAAKAAGLFHADYTGVDYDGRSGLMLTDEIGRQTFSWSPLTDDGDALRLAVKLGIEIELFHSRTAYAGPRGAAKYAVDAEEGLDIQAATRRAIVRAAAEIGEIK